MGGRRLVSSRWRRFATRRWSAEALAAAVGVRNEGSAPLLDRLTADLIERRLLLVLDNLEHVLTAAPVVSRLLAACPGLTA